MRLIVIGCEYAGTSTLTDNIAGWIERAMGGTMGKHDHWKIPEVSHQPHTREENQGFLALSANLRESFQRYHMEYHLQPGFYESATPRDGGVPYRRGGLRPTVLWVRWP